MADWYYAQGTVQRGPVPIEFVIDSLRSGVLKSDDLVWREGLADWIPAGHMPELAGAWRLAVPPRLPPPAPPMPAVSPQSHQIAGSAARPHVSPAPSPHASLAVTSMVLGLVAFILLPLGSMLGIPALVCGLIALRGMRRTGNRENWGMALAGVLLGIFWTLIGALVAACALLWWVCATGTSTWSVTTSPPPPPALHSPFGPINP